MEEDDVPEIEGFSDLEFLGDGGFGTVYTAVQLGVGRRVAVKVVSASRNEARRIEREASALGRLSDIRHVVQVHQVAHTRDGRPAIVMSLMERSLAGAAKWPDRNIDRALKWLDQVSSALDAAHAVGTIHRDVKPDNILLDKNDDAYLADFGISLVPDAASSTDTLRSASPPYVPPERLTSNFIGDEAGDVYSLAATFYEVIWGKPPFGTFQEGGEAGLFIRITSGPVPCASGMPPAVHEVMKSALAKRPVDRPASATQFAADLRAAVHGVRGATDPNSSARAASPPPHRRAVGTAPEPVPEPVRASPTKSTAGQSARRGARRLGILAIAALVVATAAAGTSRWYSTRRSQVEDRPTTSTSVAAAPPASEESDYLGVEPEEQVVPAPVGEDAAPIPGRLVGYKKDGSLETGTVRVFVESTSTITELLNGETGCGQAFWTLRWRSQNPDLLIRANVAPTALARDATPTDPDTSSGAPEPAGATEGLLSGFFCSTPTFEFDTTQSLAAGVLADVVYEYQWWIPRV